MHARETPRLFKVHWDVNSGTFVHLNLCRPVEKKRKGFHKNRMVPKNFCEWQTSAFTTIFLVFEVWGFWGCVCKTVCIMCCLWLLACSAVCRVCRACLPPLPIPVAQLSAPSIQLVSSSKVQPATISRLSADLLRLCGDVCLMVLAHLEAVLGFKPWFIKPPPQLCRKN